MNARPALLLLVALAAGPVCSQSWDELTEAQREALAPWAEQWPALDEKARQRLVEGAERWATLSPEEREEVRERFERWRALPEDERAEIRERAERFENLPPAQRERLQRTLRQLRQLPPRQRAALRSRWESMSPEQRRAFLEGAMAGAHLRGEQLQRTLTDTERTMLRRAVGELAPPVRRSFLRTMRALPADQRAAFAREILEAAPGQRERLIRERSER
ncbi:MAG: DUF3106 domain-containing protein [Wenzhouxiangellaceae bacterium]|nr:DUF3106 domain-containing protein [Wenzhouxiangellaceae bacterium]